MQNRKFDPYLAANYRILDSLMYGDTMHIGRPVPKSEGPRADKLAGQPNSEWSQGWHDEAQARSARSHLRPHDALHAGRQAGRPAHTCDLMMRSMLADQPNLEVTRAQGESASRRDTTTFSTLSPRVFFMNSVSPWSSVAASSACGNALPAVKKN
jgi:hypothetical protein